MGMRSRRTTGTCSGRSVRATRCSSTSKSRSSGSSSGSGGVNGAGKTTLLDAIQLALYGTRARCSKRTNLAYDEFLRQSIHHGVSEYEGAGISLCFRYASGGEEHIYDVSRSWSVVN